MTDDRPSPLQPCCANEDNLLIVPSDRPDVIKRVCKVCGRKHLELTADAGHIGVKLT